MSETMLVAVVTGLFSLLGVWLGTFLTEKRYKTDRKDKFALVALDKKLDVHQKAFALAVKMVTGLLAEQTSREQITKEAVEFWNNNCLFLSYEAREAFQKGISDFVDYSTYWRISKDKPEIEKFRNECERIRNDLRKLLGIVAESVGFANVSNVLELGEENKLKQKEELNK